MRVGPWACCLTPATGKGANAGLGDRFEGPLMSPQVQMSRVRTGTQPSDNSGTEIVFQHDRISCEKEEFGLSRILEIMRKMTRPM